ncbi:MAG: HAD family hydrolase [Pseudomonadota bacterium]
MIDKKALLFDWDGTLVDTCGLILDAHNHVREFMGHKKWTMDDFLGQASQSAREYYPKVYGERADEAQTFLYDYVEAHHLDYIQVMEGALEFLQYARAEGYLIGIVSNKRHKTLLREIDFLGWHEHFDYVIGAGVAKTDKPTPEPIFMAVDQINDQVTLSDVLYVGDTETDLLAAQNAQIPVIFIQSDKERPDLIEKYAPSAHFLSFLEFANAFRDVKSEDQANIAING